MYKTLLNEIETLVKERTNAVILNVYMYGSVVYGTWNDQSDIDFIVITDCSLYIQIQTDEYSINVYNVNDFQKMINMHSIDALECLFLDDYFVLKEFHEFEFFLDTPRLRHVISQRVSNSWVKAKKKIELPNEDSYIGIKSLFHSFRMIDLGKQLSVYSEIRSFDSMNDIWYEILPYKHESWEYFYNKYKKHHNNYMTEFRKLTPKV